MYTLKQLALITGLTERTLRNYLRSELLTGEKRDGKWYFSDRAKSGYNYRFPRNCSRRSERISRRIQIILKWGCLKCDSLILY